MIQNFAITFGLQIPALLDLTSVEIYLSYKYTTLSKLEAFLF